MAEYLANYKAAFQEALSRYTNRATRQGFEPTFFSLFRHSYKKYPQLKALEEKLNQCKNQQAAKDEITKHFTAKKNRFNYHSFNSYLLDVLAEYQKRKQLPEYDWQQHNPHRIYFYKGILYRGDPHPTEEIFKNGFKYSGTEYKNKCIANYTGSNGISTSTHWNVAYEYTVHVSCLGDTATLTTGCVYKINYQGDNGIDILRTLKQHGRFISWFFAYGKHEVNIVGEIPAKNIVGAWDYREGENGKWIANQNYGKKTVTPNIIPLTTNVCRSL